MPPDTTALNPEGKNKSSGIFLGWLQGVLIIALVCIAYFPALRGDFLWDDDSNVTGNVTLRSLDGLRQIWLVPGATQQYYPLTHTSFWVDYHLWGFRTSRYHAVNIGLHALSAILLWTILRRLKIKGAWLGAAIFALHPVNVESVAWITERKNTLSGVFFLLAILAALKFWLPEKTVSSETAERGPWKFYWLTLGLYICALLSKTSTIGLPLVVLILVWWKDRLTWKKVYPLLPFLAVGAVLGCITMWVEKDHLGASGKGWAFSPLDRCLLSARMVWFYLGKLFWPHPLMFIYPRWAVPPSQLIGYIAGVAALGVSAILWLGRNSWTKSLLCAAGYFVIMLFPVLAFFNVYFFHISFVSDHFQYLAGMGPIALAAAGINALTGDSSRRKPILKPLIYGMLLLALGALTWRQAGIYRNDETLWRDTLTKNPNAWLAHNNLANDLMSTGRLDEALEHYRRAVEINPDYMLGHNNYGAALILRGRLADAEVEVRKALQLEPNQASARMSLATILYSRKQLDEAIAEFRATLQVIPTKADAHLGLAKALTDKGEFAEALTEFSSIPPDYPLDAEALDKSGYALTAQGRLDEAEARLQESIRLNPNSGIVHFHYAICLNAKGNMREAINEYRKSVELDDQLTTAYNNLAWTLATSPDADIRNGNDAVTFGERACQLTDNRQPIYLGTLAAAYAEAGRFSDAIATAQKACELAQVAGLTNVVERNNQLLELYRANQPYHEPGMVH